MNRASDAPGRGVGTAIKVASNGVAIPTPSRSGSARFAVADRAAVEPVAALVAVLVVGIALGLYAGALEDARPEHSPPVAETALDRAEQSATVGGIVEPERLDETQDTETAVTVELEADGKLWTAVSGGDAPGPPGVRSPDAVAVAERTVTVRVAPGRNVRGTLRAVVWR